MNATLIANTGPTISVAGNITFSGNATGDLAHVKVFGNGNLNISAHNPPGVAVGSIEGDGYILLGSNALTVDANNGSTTFAGHIQDSANHGTLAKTGAGTLVLSNANTQTGGTRIDGGTLRASSDGALGGAAQNGTSVIVGPGGTLTLDSGATNDYIANRGSLSIATGSTVNLNFSGPPDRVRSLLIDGVTQPPGLYGGSGSGARNPLPQFTGPGTILATTKAVSRKVQGGAGAFDVDLPLTGTSGVECRSGDPNGGYQIVVTFANDVTFSFAAVVLGAGSVAGASGSGTSEVTVNLTGVSNAQIISVGLFDLNDGTETTNLVIPMGILIGDVDGNRVVNASDVVRAKLQLGQPVTGSNFRTDVIPNGVINASDVFQVKFRLGTSLP
ncbi:MAG TPA: autotransporter-associated beta strand repeat-containing protein [Terriglobales bacterium]|nr:autotransporter-associated beta strand repeat-containing protein [Terriglobales bacterium]